MRNEQQIVELAKAIRANETLEAMYRGDTMGGNKPAYLSRQIIDLLHLIAPELAVSIEEYEVCFATHKGGITAPLFRPKGKDLVCSFGQGSSLACWQRGGWKTGTWHPRTVSD